MKWVVATVLLLSLQDVEALRKEMADDAYGNLWDRRDAARDLGRMATREAAAVLVDFAGRTDPPTREAIVLGIASIKDDTVRRWILDVMPRQKDEKTRADLIWAFRRMGWEDARDAIHGMLRDGSALVRAEAARTLGALKDPRCAEAADDKAAEPAEQALLAAAELKAAVDDRALDRLLKKGAPRVQAAALYYVAAAKPDALQQTLSDLLKRGAKPEVRIAAADVSPSLDDLKELSQDKDWRVRVASVGGLERHWTLEAVELLIERMQKEDGRLVLDIALALERMTGRSLGFDPKAWKTWWASSKDGFKMPEKPKPGARRVSGQGQDTRASFFNVPILSKRIVFLIDASGSMKNEDEIYKGKRKIDVAIEELEKALTNLPSDAKFNVIMLSTEATRQKVRSLSPKGLVPATPPNRKKAVELVKDAWKKLEPIRRGRGDVFDALMEGQADGETDTLVLLSDGVATDGRYLDRDHLVEAIAVEHRYFRAAIHTILTGSRGIDERGMEAIAEKTGGIFMPRK